LSGDSDIRHIVDVLSMGVDIVSAIETASMVDVLDAEAVRRALDMSDVEASRVDIWDAEVFRRVDVSMVNISGVIEGTSCFKL
jgi:hypothetical protein